MHYSIGTLVVFAFLLYCVLDVVLTDAGAVRNLPKLVWLLLVVFLPLIGGIAWLVGGRPQAAGMAPGSRTSYGPAAGRNYSTRGNPVRGRPRPPPSRPVRGPDDDPEFLRGIEERLRRRDDD